MILQYLLQAIKEYDLDKDGKLNYNEFLKSHAKKWNSHHLGHFQSYLFKV